MSAAPGGATAETQPGVSRRRLLVSAVLFAGAAVALYLLLPRLAGLDDTWRRCATAIRCGFSPPRPSRSSPTPATSSSSGACWRAAVVAGPARERAHLDRRGRRDALLAAGGAGGIALTAWALRRSGLPARMVGAPHDRVHGDPLRHLHDRARRRRVRAVRRRAAGSGARGADAVPGSSARRSSVVALLLALVPHELASRHSRRRVVRWVAVGSATVGDGVREALALAAPASGGPSRRRPAWWGFDIAVLWACLHAFGGSPPVTAVVMAYFVGMLGDPAAAGRDRRRGRRDDRRAIGFGVPGGLAIAAVLSYPRLPFWLPTVPGIRVPAAPARRARVGARRRADVIGPRTPIVPQHASSDSAPPRSSSATTAPPPRGGPSPTRPRLAGAADASSWCTPASRRRRGRPPAGASCSTPTRTRGAGRCSTPARKEAPELAVAAWEARLAAGAPASAIAEVAREVGADAIVVGSRGFVSARSGWQRVAERSATPTGR